MQERGQIESGFAAYRDIEQSLEDFQALAQLGAEEAEAEVLAEAEAGLIALASQARQRQLASLLGGEADDYSCYLEINAGAGGTEAQDWALMMLRLYTRWAERRGYKVESLAESSGEEAGIKSATLQIKGELAYGWLKTESGVHRLVRISPFDSSARRHTSFASVWVTPVVDEQIDIEILDKDIRIDTYRASGAGGQHVNTTDVGHPHYPSSHQHCGTVPKRPQSAQKQGDRDEYAPRQALRARVTPARDGGAGQRSLQNGHRLGASDPLLCAATLPAGQRPADPNRNIQYSSGVRWRHRPLSRSGLSGENRPGRAASQRLAERLAAGERFASALQGHAALSPYCKK